MLSNSNLRMGIYLISPTFTLGNGTVDVLEYKSRSVHMGHFQLYLSAE